MLNILILMAGRGTRFQSISENIPKPLIKLHDEPLVRWVIENLSFEPTQRFLFVCLEEHVQKFNLKALFQSWKINFEIIEVKSATEGAACSALLAKNHFKDEELIIANSDQFLIYDKAKFLDNAREIGNATIMSMNASGTKWSYIATAADGFVTNVKEKIQISNVGTTGVYYFKHGNLFTDAAEEMIHLDDRYNNEFYLAPTYNYLIKKKMLVNHFNIGDIGTSMFSLGTAEDYVDFKNNPLSIAIKKELFDDKNNLP